MTLTADIKGRLCSRELFTPRASFTAEKQEDGAIVLRKLAPVQEEVEVLTLKDVDPNTLLPKDGSRILPESIVAAIRADRDGKR